MNFTENNIFTLGGNDPKTVLKELGKELTEQTSKTVLFHVKASSSQSSIMLSLVASPNDKYAKAGAGFTRQDELLSILIKGQFYPCEAYSRHYSDRLITLASEDELREFIKKWVNDEKVVSELKNQFIRATYEV